MSRHNAGAVFYLDSTHHSIVAATQPGMLEYFPMIKEGAVKDMLQASAVVYINKDEVQRHIMKWVVICALKKDCIAPPGFVGLSFLETGLEAATDMTSLCKISLFRTLITMNTRNISTGVKILPLWPGGNFP